MAKYNKKKIGELIDGTLEFYELKDMMSSHKDPERFGTYMSVLQERVTWDDPIILPAGLHLYIVQKASGDRIVKCDCGHEFCDYKDNWKLHANIYVRDTEEKMNEIYPKLMAPDTDWQVIREYYCPGCDTQLEVEAVTPWYPIIKDFEPDIDTFYNEWLKIPLPTVKA
ncbi:acetone carboxylase subunit gamma [Sporosarcina sp. GW1-11]|uniref:acetone carboxylase subunit gamma n=1 Tax=unclassified Sporosarcina TaxID=2647733 RepID=UPI000C1736B1|nr:MULTISPECIES: acetone carboxylase subunit gamma [unclassified Sporosarcina]MDV6379006.1 acetone carboxylase subunit gamma [Sporosarcina sp. GW1-11]PIC64673.1 acetone carboxylase subunit gamma [Sporosarcina sp. P13]